MQLYSLRLANCSILLSQACILGQTCDISVERKGFLVEQLWYTTDVVMWHGPELHDRQLIQWLKAINRDLLLKIFPVLQLGATESLQPYSRILEFELQLKLVNCSGFIVLLYTVMSHIALGVLVILLIHGMHTYNMASYNIAVIAYYEGLRTRVA